MSLYESPSESPVERDSERPVETSDQERRPPRRADTLPVRFEESGDQTRETYATRRQPRVYGNPLPPTRHPTFDRGAERERRRSPVNRYQTYYESDEEEVTERRNVSRPRDDYGVTETEVYETYQEPEPRIDYRRREARYVRRRSASISPPPQVRSRVSERVIERRTERSVTPVGRVREIERERAYSPMRTYGRERVRERMRTPSPYRSRVSRVARSRSPTYEVVRRSRRSRLERDNDSEDAQLLPSGIDEDDLDSQAYAFTFSRHPKSLIGTDSGFGSITDVSEKVDLEAAPKLAGHKIRHVSKAQYVGDGVIGGHHAVKLTETAESSPQNRKTTPSLFRWIHFEDTNMDFDQFQSNASAVGNITEAEKSAIIRLLGKVKKRYDKPLQTSRSVKSRYMAPSFLQESISTDSRPKFATKTRSISWICIPYFCLENYATTTSSVRPSAHPMRTILQARYSLVQKERDMQQAYRLLLPETPAETCFHIAQLWFIILDDSLLISCSRMSMPTLQGDIISFTPKGQASSLLSESTSIIVSGRHSIIWSLPVAECQNWFAFISHFWEYWPRSPTFTYHDKAVGVEEWPRILVLASKSNVRLSLDFKNTYKEPVKGVLIENPFADALGSPAVKDLQNPIAREFSGKAPALKDPSGTSTEATSGTFRVFTWLATESTRGGASIVSPESKNSEVYQDLKEIDDFLLQKTSLNEKLTYRSCPPKAREDLYQLITLERSAITNTDVTDQEQNKLKRYETKVDILNAAESLFQFFLPPDLKAPTVDKFWGALYKIFEPPMEFVDSATSARQFQFGQDASEVLDWLKNLNRSVVPFRASFSQAQQSETNIRIPDALAKAYLHLLMALAFISNDMQLFDEQMAICNDLCELGMRDIVQNISRTRLSEYATFIPTELASLISYQVIQDVTGPAIDICETYWEYIKALQAKIENNPLDRGHQDKIGFFLQETSVISETLEQQAMVLGSAQPSSTYLRPRRDGEYDAREISRTTQRRTQGMALVERTHDNANQGLTTFLAPSPQHAGLDPSGVQGLVAQDAMSIIDGRIKDFREMKEQASDLGSWNIQRIDSNKDRQEAAVYAFTVVTIIFLPLSTVAGIMGMNTNDVRNMEVNQWVFWATALPLTVLIVTLCLVWAGELNNFFEGLSKLWKKKPAYAATSEMYTVRKRDQYEDEPIVIRNNLPPPLARRSRTIYGAERESYV